MCVQDSSKMVQPNTTLECRAPYRLLQSCAACPKDCATRLGAMCYFGLKTTQLHHSDKQHALDL